MDENLASQYDDEVNAILRSRHEFISKNYPQVREAYQQHYLWPEMDTLRHEISLALIFGLHQAAITLTNHLLESLLKNSLIVVETKLHKQEESDRQSSMVSSLMNLFKPALSRYGSSDLGANIDRACKLGIITREEEKQLNEFRVRFRNAYSHSDKQKTFGNLAAPFQGAKFEGDQLIVQAPEEAKLADFPIGHGIFQAMQAREDSIPYFRYMDALVRSVRGRIFHDSTPKTAT